MYDGKFEKEHKERNIHGRRVLSLLNSGLWYQPNMKSTKTCIYNTIGKSITTYGSEIWLIGKKMGSTLEATKMNFWRRSVGRRRLERKRITE